MIKLDHLATRLPGTAMLDTSAAALVPTGKPSEAPSPHRMFSKGSAPGARGKTMGSTPPPARCHRGDEDTESADTHPSLDVVAIDQRQLITVSICRDLTAFIPLSQSSKVVDM